MLTKKALVAVLTASTFLTTGAAFAQGQTPTDPSAQQTQSAQKSAGAQQTQSAQQKMAEKDFSKLSTQGSMAFQDVALTRLAIFDGRVEDAKKFVTEADTALGKAKNDETVFIKAEADLRSPDAQSGRSVENGPMRNTSNASASNKASDASSAQSLSAASGKPSSGTNDSAVSTTGDTNTQGAENTSANMKKPTKWLPVDGEISISDNYTANPTKAAAVAEANKSLAKGDRKGALDKLKLADVNLDIVLAVVPVDQTVNDVHQAAQMVTSGKYYEASQLLRKVQDSARFDVADIVGMPSKGSTSNQSQNQHEGAGSASTH